MKNHFFFALAFAIAVVVSTFTAQAQQTTNGQGNVNTLGYAGDATNGGNNGTGGTGTYNATLTPGQASGAAALTGTGASTTNPANARNDVSSNSTADLGFSLNTTGGPQSALTMTGFAGEGAWSKATPPVNGTGDYSDSAVGTGAKINGGVTNTSGGNPLTMTGDATANGKTNAGITVSADGLTADARAKTLGTSNAGATSSGGTPTPVTTSVTGASGIEGGVAVQGPNSSGAGGFFQANGSYAGSNPAGSATGLTQAQGNTHSTVCPNGSCASSATSVSSSDQAKP